MKNAWDEKRSENYIVTYGPPSKAKPRYKNRMMFASDWVLGNSVLDVGCGVGHLYGCLNNQITSYKGIDSSMDMIRIAKKHFSSTNFEIGDAYDLSKEALFDTVISMSLLIHINQKDLQQIIEQMWRHTKKALVFSIPIDKDFSKVVKLTSGKTLITHLSDDTLDHLLSNLKPKSIDKTPFPEGCFGYGLNDHLIRVVKGEI